MLCDSYSDKMKSEVQYYLPCAIERDHGGCPLAWSLLVHLKRETPQKHAEDMVTAVRLRQADPLVVERIDCCNEGDPGKPFAVNNSRAVCSLPAHSPKVGF